MLDHLLDNFYNIHKSRRNYNMKAQTLSEFNSSTGPAVFQDHQIPF